MVVWPLLMVLGVVETEAGVTSRDGVSGPKSMRGTSAGTGVRSWSVVVVEEGTEESGKGPEDCEELDFIEGAAHFCFDLVVLLTNAGRPRCGDAGFDFCCPCRGTVVDSPGGDHFLSPLSSLCWSLEVMLASIHQRGMSRKPILDKTCLPGISCL